jgi:hypothetical protein
VSGDGGLLRGASGGDPEGQRRWRPKAGHRRQHSPRIERRRRPRSGRAVAAHPGLMSMVVARGAVGFDSGCGGLEGARWQQIWEARTCRQILEARARHLLLGGTCPGVAPTDVPSQVTTSAFLRHEGR